VDLVFLGAGCFVCGWWLRGITPDTFLALHRRAFQLWWRWRSRPRGGRPRLDPELIALIRRISFENPLWGAPRIHGELLKLGFRLAQSTVSKYMLPRKGRASQSWGAFLRNNTPIAAIDMLTVRTVTFDCLYAFIVLAHDRRRILHIEVARRANAWWLARQIAEAFRDKPPRIIVRDNDGAYGEVFRRQLRAMGIRDRPTMPHSPWQNGHVERLIGSIRRECLDHCLIWNATHLRRVLREYADYYNNDRTHLALAKDSPNSRSIDSRGRIVSRRVLGGLHRRYFRMPLK
jgi:putative transposase